MTMEEKMFVSNTILILVILHVLALVLKTMIKILIMILILNTTSSGRNCLAVVQKTLYVKLISKELRYVCLAKIKVNKQLQQTNGPMMVTVKILVLIGNSAFKV